MNSKKSELLLSNALIIVAICVVMLVVERLFRPTIAPYFLLDLALVLGAAALYLFLSAPMIDQFLKRDQDLKAMVDETLHELNTPIATIEANVALLKKSITDEKNLKRLERIKGASQNLTKLYESIEYNIKENIQLVEKTVFDLKGAVDASILKFQELSADVTITNETPFKSLMTDKNGFEKLLDNLISNAIKYNKKGGFVKVFMKENTLFVEDNGIGIDTKNLFIVFEKSFQENPTTEGFGLGLSIVKTFCDTHKIKIKIDTKKEVGTTIMLDLGAIVV